MDEISESKVKNQNNIFYYWDILKKWKRFLIINIVTVTIISTVIAFVLPVWYYSYAVLKPSQGSGMNIFSAVLGAKGLSAIGKSLNVGGLQYSDLDYYQSLLGSRKISLEVINKFDLRKVYNEHYIFKTINQLLANTQFQGEARSNLLIIGAYDKNPLRSKNMVSFYIRTLDSLVTNISRVDLTTNREAIQKRYYQNLSDLDTAQNKLKQFQEKYGVVLPEEQFTSTVKAYAEIAAQKLILQTQLNGLKLNIDKNSPVVMNLERQIQTLDNKLNELNSKTNLKDKKDLFVTLGNAPELIDKYITLYRDVTIQSKLLELTYPLYQQAKMDELSQAPPFIVIDKPFIPEYKAKPKRAIIMATGFALSLILSVFFVFIWERIKKIKEEYNSEL